MRTHINCVHECDLPGMALLSSRTTDNVIERAVKKFNMKSNEVISDLRLSVMNFKLREVHYLYIAWTKAVRKLWRTKYCNLLHKINNSLPIQISLEKREVKSIWSCLNSENYAVKTVSHLATNCHVLFLDRITDIFHICSPSCHTSGTSHITLFIIPKNAINVSLTDIPFIIRLAHLVGEGVEWVYW